MKEMCGGLEVTLHVFLTLELHGDLAISFTASATSLDGKEAGRTDLLAGKEHPSSPVWDPSPTIPLMYTSWIF
jgi:hypothetical protein